MPSVRMWEEYDLKIDRSTKWGNRYHIGKDGDRATVIAKFRLDLWEKIKNGAITLEELAELHRKRLACHCAPNDCHGDVLLAAAAWAKKHLDIMEKMPRSEAAAYRKTLLNGSQGSQQVA